MTRLLSATAYLVVLLCLLLAQPALAETVYYYHPDPVGTPLAITDQSGAKVWEADYLPFGEVYTETTEPDMANDRKFVGKERDEESGLDYFGARYHYAKIGRFLAPDPVRAVDINTGRINAQVLADLQRGNVYAYSLNNPYKYVDKDGEFAQLALLPLVEWGLPALISILSVKAANDTYWALNENSKDGKVAAPEKKSNDNEATFPDEKELAKKLGIKPKEIHDTKKDIKKDHPDELKKLKAHNPDIGYKRDGTLVLKNRETGKTVTTGSNIKNYKKD